MKLTILGCHGWPPAGGAASGYLLEEEGFRLWLDAGNGTMANLQEHIGLDEVDAIAISHAHGDHCADLGLYFTAMGFGGLGSGEPVPLVAPPGFLELRWGATISDDTRSHLKEVFTYRGVVGGDAVDLGPFSVAVFAMDHPLGGVGYRITAGEAVMAYTGDTGPGGDIEALARDADVLVCEATLHGPAPQEYPFHLSGEQAGTYAAAAGARTLVLTHFWPTSDAEVSRAQAARSFGGEIVLAERGMSMEVGR